MPNDEDSEFLKSLRIGEDLEADGPAQPNLTAPNPQLPADAKPLDVNKPNAKKAKPSLRTRFAKQGRNVSFNHTVLEDTVAGFYEIAIKHEWTMNKTLTIAQKLLAEADKQEKL